MRQVFHSKKWIKPARLGDPQRRRPDLTFARSKGWAPTTSLEVGLHKTLAWFSRRAARGGLNQSRGIPRLLSIFVPHGASTLSDYALNGDALVQWSAICELARRGHRITVVAPAASIRGDIPRNVDIHIVPGGEHMSLPRYVWKAYAIYRRLRRTRRFDLVHQMNPVVRGGDNSMGIVTCTGRARPLCWRLAV